MAKTAYKCSNCGSITPKWQGQCPSCTEWNTLEETVIESKNTSHKNKSTWTGSATGIIPLKAVSEDNFLRYPSNMPELDRVLGGGLVKASVVLLAGDPGIGKSTLLLQALAHYSATKKVLYCSGEESLGQIKMRANRLGVDQSEILMLSEVDLEKIIQHCEMQSPDILVIDSIQTVFSNLFPSAAGSTTQLRECAAKLTRMAKSTGLTILMIGHVTKTGDIAGPQVLEHIVDAVLHFEGDNSDASRVLRAIKNRYGAAHEVGIFAMGEQGLEEVSNPSSMFLTHRATPVSGAVTTATVEGSRPFLVEVQVLVEDSMTANPKRFASGTDVGRIQLLLAILNKFTSVDSLSKNVYVKIVGGVRLSEPAIDLGVLMAAYSSLVNTPLPSDLCVVGEVGLTGEIRAIPHLELRVSEAAKLGFSSIMIPEKGDIKGSYPIRIIRVKHIRDALQQFSKVRSQHD